ncbi:MAG: DUF5681 domain-containing protein [Afipia sp.]
MSKASRKATSYEVGYAKPPKATRFRKGRSGNPRGRNRGDENLMTIFKSIASRRIKVRIGDKTETMTLAEAVIFKNYKAALQKNPLAMGNMFRLAEESGEMIDMTNAEVVGKPIAIPLRPASVEEFLAEFGRSPDTE